MSLEFIARVFTRNLLGQLVSTPVDLRIEKSLYDSYEGLRESQARSLSSIVDGIRIVNSDSANGKVPRRILHANLAMNYAYVEVLREVIVPNTQTIAHSARASYYRTGRRLVEAWLSMSDSSGAADSKLVDTWADIQGLVGWYDWRDIKG